jgi:FdhD protein
VIEEPLEIRIEYGAGERVVKKSVSITMRTPGHDHLLAAGFLYTEGILASPDQIAEIKPCGPDSGAHGGPNIIRVILQKDVSPDVTKLERHFYTTSSCGVCGKSSLEAVMAKGVRKIPKNALSIKATVIQRLPEILRSAQKTFASTGGIHAAALMAPDGEIRHLYEDVGRHNAVDKVIGAAFLSGGAGLTDGVMVVSGRAGFELVQKSVVAGIPALMAIGAPSSLSVALAREWGMSLVGFMREGRFNVYTGEWRIEP